MTDKTADSLWSRAVKLRTNYQCEWCPNRAVHAHHMINKKQTATRWKLENGVALCLECHDYFERVSEAHGTALFRKYRPDDWAVIDPLRFAVVPKLSLDFKAIRKELRAVVQELAA